MRIAILICSLLTAGAAIADWTPAPMGRWDMPVDRGAAVRVSVQDGLALVVSDDTAPNNNPGGWFWTVDVSDPYAPVDAGELELTGVPSAIARYGDVAAVAWYHIRTNRGSVQLIDVSDPTVPTTLSEITVFGAPTAVVWVPPYLLTGVRGTNAGIDDHLLIDYVASPSTPIFAGTFLLPYATTAMDLDGSTLCLVGDAGSLASVEWLDVTDPTDIGVVESYGTNILFTSVDAEGDFVHALRPDGAYMMLELVSGEFLTFRATVDLPAPATGLARHGDVIYAAGGDLTVIDVTNPDMAHIAGSYAAGTAVDVALTDQYGVMLDAGGFWTMPLYAVPTPVTVAGFTAVESNGIVTLGWRAERAAVADFRLTGKGEGRTWMIDVGGNGSGEFSARDAAAPIGRVTYELAVNNGERWSLVGETTLDLSPPAVTILNDPYPNPFNPRVTVPFILASPGAVSLTVHDTRGRRVATLIDSVLPAGGHHIVWDGRDEAGTVASSGTYFMRLVVGESTLVSKAVMLR